MNKRQTAPYGSWKSPITTDLLVSKSIGLSSVTPDGSDVYWLEARPNEGGRQVVVRLAPDGEDVTPTGFNARTRVHEYGGRSFIVHDGTVYFSNFKDQRLYVQEPGTAPTPLTPEASLRYADYLLDTHRNRLICVCEDHTGSEPHPVNKLVGLELDGGMVELASGADFYSSPCLSPDGKHLAWLSWHHPNMPWDGTELWLADVQPDGAILPARLVAGGEEESIFQPLWSPAGVLHFVSDRTGWWNLYRWNDGRVESLYEMEAEFGLPQWQFGMTTYGFDSSSTLTCLYKQGGFTHLARLDTAKKTLEAISTPYTVINGLTVAGGMAFFIAGSATEPPAVVKLDPRTGQHDVLRRSSEIVIDTGYFSIPQAVEFPTENGLTAHGFFYPPGNRDFVATEGEKPPLLIKSHGGPTSATTAIYSLGIQYWTSRGIAVLDVNYGGSTGYGRAYRERLYGQWGVVDVDDCVNGAQYLARHGLVDGNRLAITGGSAGGYTTLCALAFRDAFKAGASHFGVSDLEALARETHKFESRYLDKLVGPYPERRDLYQSRSPIHHVEGLSCALILFQGLEDEVVPPNQAEMMFAAARRKGLPVAYLAFEGEGHGFRKAETIKRTLEAELFFYSRIFDFGLADPVEPVSIENI